MAISASQVKELREKTGAGMMDCKKALSACDGNMEKAIDWLREKGIAKAQKKASRVAAEGLTRVYAKGNKAVIFEVNAETDFVAKNQQFLDLLETIKDALIEHEPASVQEALTIETPQGTINDIIVNATATIGEKITLRRLVLVEKKDDQQFGLYMHNGGKISSLVVMEGADEQIAKYMAMQVASMAPMYVSQSDVPKEELEHETEVQQKIIDADEKLKGKPEKVLAGILKGKVSKHFQDLCLLDQEYFLEPKTKVGAFLKANHCSVIEFVRFQVGEGLEKRDNNFAAEVAEQINS